MSSERRRGCRRLDREFFDGDDMSAALAGRDIGTVYRLLGHQGVRQRRIAQVTRQSQSEVSEITKGRTVRDVWVLERIADGLGVPRAWMGLGYGERAPDPLPAGVEVDGDRQRRALVAMASAAALGQGLGDLPELPPPIGQALPARLDMTQVHTVRAVTERLRGIARYHGGQADLFSAAATLSPRWTRVPATEAIQAALAAALAELHTEARWCGYDAGLDGTGLFTRALRLAGQTRDTHGIATTAWHAGLTLLRTGYPNHALTLLQLGGFQLRPHADDPRIPILTARLARTSAAAYARMGGTDAATRYLAEANDGWEPRDTFERAGADLMTAGIQRDFGQLDTAERYAASAVRAYGEGHYHRGRTVAALLLAEIHVRAGEPQGLALARDAIKGVGTLHSVAARREWLMSLATALEARPGTDTQELARAARQIGATPI
ncbi:MAG: hypothetical protein ACRDRU_21430 [Pseudonocardiaceae bacterium]